MRSFLATPPISAVPIDAAVAVARIDLARGREELNLQQVPQVLQRLAARAKFESITASNAIEDVVVSHDRALELIRAPEGTSYHDRFEREFAGYRDAADYLAAKPPERLTVPLLLHLHRTLLRHTDDPHAGRLKSSDNIIGERHPDGSVTKIFTPVPAGEQTEWHITELVDRYERAVSAETVPNTILVALLVLDFLAIHPFEDGNGRIARLLTTCELLRHGYGVARYASLEQRIYESKNSYYLALREAQRNWHRAEHDPWPWVTYLLRVAEDAYADFERRALAERDLSGKTKREQVKAYVLDQAAIEFRFAEIEAALPDISHATIRAALSDLAAAGRVAAGRGRDATWRRPAP